MENILKALKIHKRLVIADYHALEKSYNFSWADVDDFIKIVEKPNNLVSDGMVDGFEEAVWECEIDGIKIRSTVTYGQGSITEIEVIN